MAWQQRGLCRTDEGRALDWFTGETATQASEWDAQRELCSRCPVLNECRIEAVIVDRTHCDPFGVGFHFVAGKTPKERAS